MYGVSSHPLRKESTLPMQMRGRELDFRFKLGIRNSQKHRQNVFHTLIQQLVYLS